MILTRTGRKDFDVDFEINLKIKQNGLNSLLMIVPTNRRIRALTREMVSKSPGKVTGKLNIETIGSVSSKLLFNNDSIKSDIISDAAASVILHQSFNEIKLKYFSNYNGDIPRGTLDRIRNVIAEYKRHGIAPDKIRNEAETLSGSEKSKALDIADVFEIYQKKINSSGLKETGDIYSALISLAASEFHRNYSSLYPEADLIIIMGFDEFTLPEVEIINKLAQIEHCELFLSFDYYRFNPLIFSHLDRCYENLVSKGFKEITDKSVSLFTRFQDQIRENLFRKNDASLIKDYTHQIRVISSRTREREIEIIASEIKELIINGKAEPENICVVFNLIGNYSNIIRDVFPLYGLPFNLTDRFPLDTASPVVQLINFLEIAENDFYYKNIFRALSGGIIKLEDINVTNLLRTAVNLKIISGFDNWQRSLIEAIHSLQVSEDDSATLQDQIESYRKTLKDIDKLREYLEPFLHRMSVPEFREKLKILIYKLDIPVRLLSEDIDESEKNIRSVNVFLKTADEIISLLEDEFGTDEKFPPGFYLHNLRMAVSSSRFNIKEKPGYGVQITTMNEIRGLNFEYLFIGGLCDGDFPTRFSPEIFFSGSMARTKGELNHATEERYLFYQSLCAWNKRLYLTFPGTDERKEFVQSDFLREFLNTFEVTSSDEKDYSNSIYNPEQLLEYIGKYGIEKAEEFAGSRNINLKMEEINESMRIDRERTDKPFGESVYTGFIPQGLSEAGKAQLDKMKKRQFSVSQLETYALCPYRYFAERVLKLEIFEEPTEEIEALELGSLIHSILFNFYSTIKKENIRLSNCSDKTFIRAETILFTIAESKVADVNFNSPLSFFEREKIFGVEGRREDSLLYKFLMMERENDEGYVPEFFETGFGRIKEEQGEQVLLDELKAGEISIRGKIDRIDLNREAHAFKVFDYKTGKNRVIKQDIYDGIQLQLPLYLFAAKEIIKSELNEDYEPAGALIYSLKYNSSDFGRKEINFGKKVTEEEIQQKYRELINICIKAISRYVESIGHGDFRLTQLERREEKACRFCGFRSICRIQEVG